MRVICQDISRFVTQQQHSDRDIPDTLNDYDCAHAEQVQARFTGQQPRRRYDHHDQPDRAREPRQSRSAQQCHRPEAIPADIANTPALA